MPAEQTPTPDPVTSPAPAATPSPAAQPTPAATPEPVAGVPAAPPAASDKAPANQAAKPDDATPTGIKPLGDGDALDRLTAPTEKPKENTPPVVPAPAAAKPGEAPAPVVEDPENKDAPPEDAPFKKADEKELAGYHSRTRHRIKQFQARVDELEKPAAFTYELMDAATKRDLKFESVVAWQNLGFGLRDGDPDAIQALANIVTSHGLKLAGDAPAVDVTPIEAAINEAFQSLDLNAPARERLLAALNKVKTPVQPAPQQRAPVQVQQRQQQAQPAVTEMQRTQAYVANELATLAQQIGQEKTDAVWKQILAESARREAALPLHRLNDPIDMRIRFAACKEFVLAKASQQAPKPAASATVPVQPSVRATPSPTALPVPQRGTPEYDDYVLTHGIPDRA